MKAKKMCPKCDLGSDEKCTITKLLGIGRSTLEIAKHLGRDHRTIKKCVQQPDYTAVWEVIKASCYPFVPETTSKIKRKLIKKPSSTSKTIFTMLVSKMFQNLLGMPGAAGTGATC